MFNMFDVFRQAQGGAAFDNLARAYGVSPDQLRAMTAALTPAFAQGFMRQAATDEGARRFAELFRTEDYARAFEAQAAALDPKTRGAGETALDALFGSKEVSRAVAAQAAAASGVQAQIIRQVLPVLASILMGGFMKAAQGAGAPATAFDTLFGGGAPEQPHGPFPANPFQGWIDAFGRGGEAPGGQAAGSDPVPNPLGDMMGEMMRAMFGAAAAPRPGEPAAPPDDQPSEPAKEPSADSPFDAFLATGRELSQQNAEAMSQIFDAFFGDKTRKG